MDAQQEKPEVNYMDLGEFKSSGLLQEVNRRFLHIMGLALGVGTWPDGTKEMVVIDNKATQTSGMIYPDMGEDHEARAANVQKLYDDMAAARQRTYGFVIQPLGTKPEPVMRPPGKKEGPPPNVEF